MSNHYVNNKMFLADLVERRAEKARLGPDVFVPVSNYVAECILAIATRLATKPNFSGYDYKEEMVCDGVENCLQYIDNFDPKKSSNPFAYFTSIIWYAFIRRINKEKRALYTKLRVQQRHIHVHEQQAEKFGRAGQRTPAEQTYQDSMLKFMDQYEETKRKKREKHNSRLAAQIDAANAEANTAVANTSGDAA